MRKGRKAGTPDTPSKEPSDLLPDTDLKEMELRGPAAEIYLEI